MPKAKNMVRWCLNKAKKELERDGKHRGLIKVKPDDKLVQEHIAKAEHNLEFFMLAKENKFYDWTIVIGFYTMYHCLLSILAKHGYESRNQECTMALVESLANDKKVDEIFKKYIDNIRSAAKEEEEQILPMREKYQYTPVVEIDVQKVEELLGICQDMIKDTKGVIS
ncbi:MAG: HEPN domain-containing protein [Nanoarchaeota archaeon]